MTECRDCGREGEHAHWCHLEMIRGIQEKAWDEGYIAGVDDSRYEPGYGAVNPYKEKK